MYSGGIVLKDDDPISPVRFPLIVKSEAGLFVLRKMVIRVTAFIAVVSGLSYSWQAVTDVTRTLQEFLTHLRFIGYVALLALIVMNELHLQAIQSYF